MSDLDSELGGMPESIVDDDCCEPEAQSVIPPGQPGSEYFEPETPVMDPIVSDPVSTSDSITLYLEGDTIDAGSPKLDLDADGVVDSAIVVGPQGETYIVADISRDGLADGLLLVDRSGMLVAGFNIGPDGTPEPVEVPEGMSVFDLLNPTAATSDATTDRVQPAPAETEVPAAEEDLTIRLDEPGAVGERVVLELEGEVYDFGPPTHDFDNDGVLESVLVYDEAGNLTHVVSELSAAGNQDGILVLDPTTGQVTAELAVLDGQILDVNSAAAQEQMQPQPQATTGPEDVAPQYEESSNTSVSMAQAATKQMYDMSSEIWHELTGGQPYPRHEDGTPYTPAEVAAVLIPQTEGDTKMLLEDIRDKWNLSVKSAISNF